MFLGAKQNRLGYLLMYTCPNEQISNDLTSYVKYSIQLQYFKGINADVSLPLKLSAVVTSPDQYSNHCHHK